MMYGREKSDRRVVPRKPANNAEPSATEGGREGVCSREAPVGTAHAGHSAGRRVSQAPVGRMAELDGSPQP